MWFFHRETIWPNGFWVHFSLLPGGRTGRSPYLNAYPHRGPQLFPLVSLFTVGSVLMAGCWGMLAVVADTGDLMPHSNLPT